MARLIAIMLITGMLAGCAAHSQKIKDGRVFLYLKGNWEQPAYVVSSLDRFQKHPLTRENRNTWVAVFPTDREFSYFFLLGDQPFIPDCKLKEKDDFGSENCIFMPRMKYHYK